jgi:hypothetical protein
MRYIHLDEGIQTQRDILVLQVGVEVMAQHLITRKKTYMLKKPRQRFGKRTVYLINGIKLEKC